jgi:HAE1 family hydrophobic/amphiphilic exporter-1
MNLARLSIKRPTFITAIIVVILIVGTIFMQRLPVDMFPDVNFPFVGVTTVYPGAGPREMETLVSKLIEEQISSISGLKNVTSISQDGLSIVYGEFSLETDPKYAEQQVKDKITLIRNQLPKDIEEPVVRRYDPADSPVMQITLSANLPPAKLYDLADNTVRTGFEQVPNVSKVNIIGGSKREIHVDLDRYKLKDYESSVTMVASHIGANSQNIPIGKVARTANELSFRSLGEFRAIRQIQDVVVSFFGNDIPVSISNVGTVSDGLEEEKTRGYFNGSAALILEVYKQSGSNTVEVSDNLLKRIGKLNAAISNADGKPHLQMVRDNARPIRVNLTDVKQTILEGILLAILVVYLFLGNIRSTFITVIALPNSLIGAFIFMGLAGFSVNMMTLMALSLAVGLLIDDAIVVRENIFRHMEEGMPAKEAAQKGTDEVALAVVATTMTVIAVFLPVGFLQGMIGQFFKQFGLTIVFAMVISLFDALTTAPMLSAYLIGKVRSKKAVADQEQETPAAMPAVRPDSGFLLMALHWPADLFEKFQQLLERIYEKMMRFALNHKILVLCSAFLIFVGSLALVKGIPKTFFPASEFGEFYIKLEAAPGISLGQMDRDTVQIEQMLRSDREVETVLRTVGDENGENNVARLNVKLVPRENRKHTTGQYKEYIREKLKPYETAMHPSINDYSMGGGDEKPFAVLIKGDDLDQLAATAGEVVTKFKTIPGLVDVDTEYRPGKPEFQVKMDPLRLERLGVQSVAAGMELRGMVEGMTPAKYRENGLEYDIRVRLKEDQRDLSAEFDRLYVPNVNMQLVKLRNVADPVQTTGPSKIYRRNRARYVMVGGNLGLKGAIGDITGQAKKILSEMKLPAGITYEFVGESEDMVDLFKNIIIALVLSVIFIFLVLASLYESIIVPLTIMIALPLAIVGGLIALFITGNSINMFTMIGFIMLLGLVTKNSILLVDYTQKLLRKGMSHNDALIKAGLTRLRPILMTTFALIAGMLPLALGLSEVGKFRSSMGVAIIGGLISSTLLTLVVIPAVFEYIDTFRRWTRRLLRRPELREIDSDLE